MNRWPKTSKLPHLRQNLPASAAQPAYIPWPIRAPGRLPRSPGKRPSTPSKNQLCAQALGWEEPLYEDVKAGTGGPRESSPRRGRSDSVSWPGAEPVVQPGRPRQGHPPRAKTSSNGTANLASRPSSGLSADKLRKATWTRPNTSNVVLGLIFLKYISDQLRRSIASSLLAGRLATTRAPNPEDPDEYKAETPCSGCRPSRWSQLQGPGPKQADESASSWTTPWWLIERDKPHASRGCCRRKIFKRQSLASTSSALGELDRCDANDRTTRPPARRGLVCESPYAP